MASVFGLELAEIKKHGGEGSGRSGAAAGGKSVSNSGRIARRDMCADGGKKCGDGEGILV
jgi:hypothetical protein